MKTSTGSSQGKGASHPKVKELAPPSGLLRRSHLISTFGPGAMLDLPRYSVLVGGLDLWSGTRDPIHEERLARKVAEVLGLPSIQLYAPPDNGQDQEGRPRSGVTCFTFPTWFVAKISRVTLWKEGSKVYRTRPLISHARLDKGSYQDLDGKRYSVVPVRFVQACPKGHISDIDWISFAHDDFHSECRGPLWLDEGGTGGDLAEIYVRCESCKKRRSLGQAKIPVGGVLGVCKGQRPWLGQGVPWEECLAPTGRPEFNRLLVRSASNAYYPQVQSVISIPDNQEKLRKAVDEIWESYLQWVDEPGELKTERKKAQVSRALAGLSDEVVFAEIQRRKSAQPGDTRTLKQVEIETLLSEPVQVGEDVPEGDFYARARALVQPEPWLSARLERIVLVHRLREVQALVGFTRFEPSMPDIDGELEIGVQRAQLSLEPSWVPAVENRGEGVFLAFKPDAIRKWMTFDRVRERGLMLEEGFVTWRTRRGLPDTVRFPGLPYIMLHSLSHLLVTAVSLECGYAASSVRERVYAGRGGYGILLYTGTPGAEGTLGGLVAVGRHLERHLATALELGRLCSNDPVCAQHKPSNPLEERFLQGAACHGCLLIAESSCERGNELLDRALVVPTVEAAEAEFFGGW